ncbi:helix-turn-helix transcriptional regulator [Galbibacter sp. PAP.153]|uniref:helix-turn-helix domain-containing protein n=1 Tax=Galbibacter sp. PAP.153 TaxID=3104623 RepID=UPI003007F6EF
MFNEEEIQVLKKVGENIRLLRIERDLSQFDLASEAGIPKNQIGRIERAEINTTILTLHKIANALKVDTTLLLGINSLNNESL